MSEYSTALYYLNKGYAELQRGTFSSKRRAEQYFISAAFHFQIYYYTCDELEKERVRQKFLKCVESGNSCVKDKLIIERFLLLSNSETLNINSRFHADYREIGDLGKGNFGKVSKVQHTKTNAEFACKTIVLKGLSEKIQCQIHQEIGILKALDHGNIVKLQAVYYEIKEVHLVMDLCAGQNLCDFLSSTGVLYEWEAKHFLVQIIAAVRYLHQRNIVHGDIKLENCLLQCDPVAMKNLKDIPKDDPRRHEEISELILKTTIKLADFGLAKYGDDDNEITPYKRGSSMYMSPQLFQGKECTLASDVWAVGILSYCLLRYNFPFKDQIQILLKNDDESQILLENLSTFRDIIRSRCCKNTQANLFLKLCLDPDPSTRITLDAAWKHPFLCNPESTRPNQMYSHCQMQRSISSQSAQSAGPHIVASSSSSDVLASPEDLKEIVQAFIMYWSLSKFDQLLSKAVAWSLAPSVTSRLQNVFNEIDTDGNGSVDVEELKNFLQNNCMFGVDLSFFESTDLNDEPEITSQKFIAATFSKRIYFDETHPRLAFERLDGNDEGFLTFEGMRKAIGEKMPEPEIRELFYSLDEDGNDKVDCEEILAYWKRFIQRNRASFFKKVIHKFRVMLKFCAMLNKIRRRIPT